MLRALIIAVPGGMEAHAAERRLSILGTHLAAAAASETAVAKDQPPPKRQRGALSFEPGLGEPFKYPGEEAEGLTHPEAHRRSLALLGAATPPAREAWRSAAPLRLTAEQLHCPRAPRGRSSGLSVSRSESVLCGHMALPCSVWAGGAQGA
jgi:hypothetical protein